ncbi:sushi, von Willebrand factor type A, EGF and pentraxin domain-containing 1-like [Paramuricea clavata]|uniref:Sushi, von Willebrand factor type A, EGF and pentraxin domain-containing 1-like n=1 Tax=Paramuricea clavata TaxID=317549 RepID=A0A6S7FS82_PARCT|nr:sushi, von Willebrand factor type A, EGF and pentraxin domain-containing 1-like [Paramuricea clavata]
MGSCILKVFLLAFLSDWIINAQAVEYVIHIYTADKFKAGTDAPVYLRFYDKNDKLVLSQTKIDPPGNPFEQNAHDVERLRTGLYLGELSRIEVKRGSTSFGLGDDWDLDRIEVEDPRNNYKYVFYCGCEIGKADRWYNVQVKRPFDCRNGYHLVNDKCEDVDECQASGCSDPNAICTNTAGTYHCNNCKPGYSFDGSKCADVDECINGQSQCQQTCRNTDGSYVCSCLSGLTLVDRYFCIDKDECQLGTHKCRSPAKCINNHGGYKCECPKGYENDPTDIFSCRNKNECLSPTACDYKTSVKCTDLSPGYKCECKPGFYNEKDNVCKDIDECKGGHSCDVGKSVCENLEGSYRCNCFPGYIMSGNGKSCIARTCGPVVIPNGAMVRQSRCTQQNANSFKDVCSFYCLAGYQITDPAQTQLTCGAEALWKGTTPTCRPVRCQPLRVPNNGRIRPASCSSGATYSQTCTFICYDGYNVNGANDVRCLANRTWSGSVPTCDRVVVDLWITCPASISVDLKPGESSADVSSLWKIPQKSQNAKYLTSSHKKTDRFPAGTSFVTWSVSNDNINFKTCTVTVNVNDKEKPVAVNCPKHDILIATKSEKELVELPNVQFTDNIAVKRIDYSHPNPVEIQTGSQKTITVTARDSAGNTAYCMFDVHVDAPVCGSLEAPVNGDAQCHAGILFTHCLVSCKGSKVLFNATGLYDSRVWLCEGYKWSPSKTLPDCVDYVDSNGSPCPNGKVLMTTTLPQDAVTHVKVCGDCPSGTYYENNECKLCPAGTYQSTTGKSGPAACMKCPPGTSSKAGTKKRSGCKATCAPGYFSADGFQPCELCELGEYQSNSGSKSCNRCPNDRRCTRYQGASSLVKCGSCPSISRIEPSSNVQRLRGSLLELFCYVNTTTSGSYDIRWAFNLDTPGQTLGSRIYQKKLRDANGMQTGLRLSVRDLQASASFECVLESKYAVVKKAVHVSVIDSNGVGSGTGLVSDEGLYEKELLNA